MQTCKRGHEFTMWNSKPKSDGYKKCRICSNRREYLRRLKKRIRTKEAILKEMETELVKLREGMSEWQEKNPK